LKNLKKYIVLRKRLLIIPGILMFFSCAQNFQANRVEGRQIPITAALNESSQVEKIIVPYRNHIERELNTVLAFAPKTLDKSQGRDETALGNLMADIALDRANYVMERRMGKKAEIALLNFGGIRSIIPAGNVTTRTAFELMPFENSLVVAELPAASIQKLIDYILSERKAHPVAGLRFNIAADKAVDILVDGKPLQDRNYLVVTSDYLLNGGDNMMFFQDAVQVIELDYKLRNALIDHFKSVDTLQAKTDGRIKRL
jgi:2',3'-cyclic-nucleotide 2'-phosphodiesterase (5'-nucleotidase family)